jgi:dihydrofolate reductase
MSGRDIWLFGGGALAASLLSMGLVDSIEVALMPVVLGAGIQFIGEGARGAKLKVTEVRPSSTGIVHIRYDVRRPAG